MNTLDLAKELDALARSLRALTFEARENVATKLELGRRRGWKPANKFEPKALTLAEISAALHAAMGSPTSSVELRKDVYQRRIDKHSTLFAAQAEAAVKAGVPAPTGVRFSHRITGRPEGVHDLYGATPRGDTALNADLWAWQRAAGYLTVRLVPAYGVREIERFVAQALPGASAAREQWPAEQAIQEAVRTWTEANTVLICDVDSTGRVVRCHGIDPAPFIELRKQVASGVADPLGVLCV